MMVNAVSNFFGDAAIIFILVVLGINTIRSILAYSGWSKGTRLEKFVYDRNIDEVARLSAQQVLLDCGIDQQKTRYLQITSSYILTGKASFDKGNWLESLFFLIAEHIHEFEHDVIYGKETPALSKYYINTMEASLDEKKCSLMADLLYQLYISDYKDHPKIDFVVVPKMGNPTLAMKFANKCNAVCIVCKGNSDHSRIILKDEKSGVKPILNFEGLSTLQLMAKSSKDKLNGVVVDCNCSGGSSLIRSAKEFNDIIASNSIKQINVIKNAYVLFRADIELSPQLINQKFLNAELCLHRYIDLNEELKSKLRELGTELQKHNFETCRKETINLVANIKTNAKENSLIV